MQVSSSNIVAMGGSVVKGFHFFMVALQNRTVLQVRRRVCGPTYVCMASIVEWSDKDYSENIMPPTLHPQFKSYYVVATCSHKTTFRLSQTWHSPFLLLPYSVPH